MRQNFKRIFSKGLVLILFLVGIVGSIGMLIWNTGFHLTSYHSSYEVVLLGEEADAVLDKLSNNAFSLRANYDTKSIEFQELSKQEVQNLVTKAVEEAEDIESNIVTYTNFLPVFLLQRVGLGILITLAVFMGFSFYTTGRYLIRINWKKTAILYLLYTLSLASALVLYFGLLSAASRFFEITYLSFAGLIMSMFWGLILIYLQTRELRIDEEIYFDSLSRIVRINSSALREYNFPMLSSWAFLLIVLGIGLGQNFWVEGLLSFIGLVLVILCIQFMPESYFSLLKASYRTAFARRLKLGRQKEKLLPGDLPVKEKTKAPKKIQKPSKKKKKKGSRKSRQRNRR